MAARNCGVFPAIFHEASVNYFGQAVTGLALYNLPRVPVGSSLVPRPNFSRAPCGLFDKAAGRAQNLVSGDETRY